MLAHARTIAQGAKLWVEPPCQVPSLSNGKYLPNELLVGTLDSPPPEHPLFMGGGVGIGGSTKPTTEADWRYCSGRFRTGLLCTAGQQWAIPNQALTLNSYSHTFRSHILALDVIVQTYNNIITNLLPVEQPMVAQELEKINQELEVGLRVLDWNAHGKIGVMLQRCGRAFPKGQVRRSSRPPPTVDC